MYTELPDVTEAKGKVVQSITYALLFGRLIVAFTDETFMCFGAEHGYDDDVSIIWRKFAFEDFRKATLIEAGIISEVEFQQKAEELREARRQGREACERRQYERLKAKYERLKPKFES